jgi:hypothetical protein
MNKTDLDNIPYDEFATLLFINENSILGDPAHAVILSLISEFYQIWKSAPNIRHNFELSQYFAMRDLNNISNINNINNKQCENCEIVLRYSNTVCLSESKLDTAKEKYYFVNKTKFQIPGIKCGIVEFYLKRINQTDPQTQITLAKIHVVKLVTVLDNSHTSSNKIANQIKKQIDIATSRSQTDAINASSNAGDLAIESAENIPKIIKLVNEIIDEAKIASVQMQVSRLGSPKLLPKSSPKLSPKSSATDSKPIELATIIAKSVNSKSKDSVTILVPDFQSVVMKNNQEQVFILVDATVAIVSNSELKATRSKYPGIQVINPNSSKDPSSANSNCGCQPTNSLLENQIKLVKK